MSYQILGLNEALITVNKTATSTSSILSQSIDVFYQVNECFGCQLEKYKTLTSNIEDFIISTKHKIFLELRGALDDTLICKFNSLELNHHGHYKINIDPYYAITNELTPPKTNITTTTTNSSSADNGLQESISNNGTINDRHQFYSNQTKYNCSLETIEKGDCLLCPMAMLITLLFLITIGEKIFNKFLAKNSLKNKTSHSNSNGGSRRLSSSATTRSGSIQPPEVVQTTAGGVAPATSSAEDCSTITSEGPPPPATTTSTSNNNNNNNSGVHFDPNLAEGGSQEMINTQESSNAKDNQRRQQLRGRRVSLSTIVEKEDDSVEVNSKSDRIDALDAFRGLTIAGMIMVNYGGAGYSLLEHKAWDGITLADFVFPFFIFVMGASIAISTKSMLKRGLSFYRMSLKIIKRSLLLMLLGLCLNSRALYTSPSVNNSSLYYLRLTGVLQRFSVSYLIVALVFSVELTVNKWIKAQSLYRVPILSRILVVSFELLTAINYLALYVYVTFYLDYNEPICPAGYIGPGGQTEGGKYFNCTGGAAAWLDRQILGENHLYNDHEVKEIFKTNVTHDPEGILGNTTSILLTLIGLQCGKILLRFKEHKTRLFLFSQWWAILAIACVSIIIIPINKRLWSFTFITLTGSCAFLLITLLYLLLDVYKCERTFLLKLLISGGKNSIFLYVGHSLLSNMLPWHFAVDETSHLQILFRLAWATFVWLLIAHYMASKRLFIRL